MINRNSEVNEFQNFLKPQSQNWLLVFHGQNGIGKTTLLTNLATSIGTNCAVARLDFNKISSMQWSCRAVLEELNLALRNCDLPESKWQKYQEEQKRLDRWNAEQKVYVNQINEAYNYVNIQHTHQEVVINLAADLQKFEDEANLKRASAWLDLARELKDSLVLFIDHWDLLALKGEPVFRRWILESLLLGASRNLSGFRTVLACDLPFNEPGFENGVCVRELRPLDQTDAQLLLEQTGVDRPELCEALFQRLGGNPLLLKLAGALYCKNPGINLSDLNRTLDVQAATKWLVRGIRANFTDHDSKKALTRGVILDYFNLEMLRYICENQNLNDDWYDTFSAYPFLVDSLSKPGYKEFVRTVREIQISWLWSQEQREFKRLHGIALDWYRQ